jgi:tetratricopeptide (TPR) repeat protein
VSRAAATLLAVLALAVAGGGVWLLGEDEPAPAAGPAAAQAPAAASAEDAAAPPPSRPAARAPERDDTYDRCMALAMADPERTVHEARAWRAAGGGDAAMHCEATARLRAGDAGGAAELLEELGRTAFAPEDARAALLAQAAQIRLEAGDLTRAYAAVTLALALRPQDPDMLTDRAVIAASSSRFQEAIDDLSRAIDLRPFRAEPYVLRASAWRQLGEPALARDDIARALAREPLNQEAWLESGNLRRDAGDLRGARADWEQAVRIAPETATAVIAAGNIALLGQVQDAQQAPPRAAEPAAAPPALPAAAPPLPLPPGPPRRP